MLTISDKVCKLDHELLKFTWNLFGLLSDSDRTLVRTSQVDEIKFTRNLLGIY